MALEIGGQGVVGLAFETVLGTYIAPTKWIPIRSETLQKVEEKSYRMNIRGIADRQPSNQGNFRIEGDIEFEVTRENLVYFLYASRLTPVKTGVGPYTYTFTPAHVAKPTTGAGASARKTLSILTGRGSRPFGYTGLSVSQLAFSLDNETLICSASLMGLNEAQQTIPAQTWPTSLPYGPQENSIEIPTATPRTDVDTWSCTINDNGAYEHRVDGTRAPSFNRWGEREVTWSCEVDFDALTDYNAFLNQTLQALLFKASKNAADDELSIALNGTVPDAYPVNLPSLGDLVRATLDYHATYNAADAFSIVVKTTENIV